MDDAILSDHVIVMCPKTFLTGQHELKIPTSCPQLYHIAGPPKLCYKEHTMQLANLLDTKDNHHLIVIYSKYLHMCICLKCL